VNQSTSIRGKRGDSFFIEKLETLPQVLSAKEKDLVSTPNCLYIDSETLGIIG